MEANIPPSASSDAAPLKRLSFGNGSIKRLPSAHSVRGPIEALDVHLNGRTRFHLPRSSERGPIEARWPRTPTMLPFTLPRHQNAAPLKLCKDDLRNMHKPPFRAHRSGPIEASSWSGGGVEVFPSAFIELRPH